jgi:transposase
MNHQEREAARAQFLAFCDQGYSWSATATAAGLSISRATAFRLRRRARLLGDQAVRDHRHGQPYLVSPAIRNWIGSYCHRHPYVRTRLLQAALLTELGTPISRTHLNRVRRSLGVPAPRTAPPKTVPPL